MTMKVRDAGGVLRTITRCRVRDGQTLRNIIRMKVMDGDSNLQTVATFAQPLTLNANGVGASGFDSVQTGSSTATPSGGLGPYSYSWTKVSGTTMTLSGANTATAGFTSPTLSPGQIVEAVYRCTCTDSSGQTATADIGVTFQFLDPFF